VCWLPGFVRKNFEKNNMVFAASMKPEMSRFGLLQQFKLLKNDQMSLLIFGCIQSTDPEKGPDYFQRQDPNKIFFNYGLEFKIKI
jgi:hypothetical protein